MGRQSRGGPGRQVKLAVRKKDWDASPSDPIMKRSPCRLRREARNLAGSRYRAIRRSRISKQRSRSPPGSVSPRREPLLDSSCPKRETRRSSLIRVGVNAIADIIPVHVYDTPEQRQRGWSELRSIADPTSQMFLHARRQERPKCLFRSLFELTKQIRAQPHTQGC